MAVNLYCWRCDKNIPMLDEAEWQILSPLLTDSIQEIQQYRTANNCSLAEALAQGNFGSGALDKYQTLTGFAETDINLLWHHRASIYGPPCTKCSKPLRTPNAKLCAACGERRA
jgi:hypothetical protein